MLEEKDPLGWGVKKSLTRSQAMMPSLNQIHLAAKEEPSIFEQVKSYVLANYSSTITIDQMARATGQSRFGFCRKFYRECRVPPIRWLWHFRVLLAARLIELYPQAPLVYICYECGFKSAAHFSRAFKSQMGVNPSQFRKMCEVQTRKEDFTSKASEALGVKNGEFLTDIMAEALRTA